MDTPHRGEKVSGLDRRPSDRAGPGPRRVGLISVHTSPLEQPGTGDSGGMNVYISALAEQLAGGGTAVEIFTRAAGRDLPPTLTVGPGVRVHHLEAGPPGATKSDLATHLCAFYLGLAAHPVVPSLELLHGHYWMSGWVGRQARARLGLPLVATFHTLARAKNAALAPGDTPEPALRLAAEDRVVAAADAVVAPTVAEARLLAQHYGARPDRVAIVEPGVNLQVFHADGDRQTDRATLGGGRIILFVGRLQPLKAPDLAIRTLAALDDVAPVVVGSPTRPVVGSPTRPVVGSPTRPDAGSPMRLGDDGLPTRLVIVGGASGNGIGTTDPASLRALAAELGVADRVAFLAPRPQAELAALYRAADAVIVPSHSESFGLVALEAQACGTPVVGSSISGLRNVVAPGGGTLVGDRDPRSFARALMPYLYDPALRARAGQAARRHALGYGWERTARLTRVVYERVLGRSQGQSAAGARLTGDQRRGA